jgi:prolipoprotein diacylglyceryl transferase
MPYFEIYIIKIGPLEIYFWGLMVALGFSAAIALLAYYSKKIGLKTEKVLDLSLWLVVSGLIGARLFYVINEWPYFSRNLAEIIYIWQGGLAWYGGVILAAVTGWWYLRRNNISFGKVSDIAVMSLALGEMIGRVGCLAIHDHLGKPTNAPWGVEIAGAVRHETAFYSIVATLVIFITLWLIRRVKWGKMVGNLTALYLIMYGISSFFIYQYRAVDLPGSDPVIGALRPSQLFSVLALLVGSWLIFEKPWKKNNL